EVGGVAGETASVPLGGEGGEVRRPRVAVQVLAGHHVRVARLPAEVRPQDPVVDAARALAVGQEEARERAPEVAADAADRDRRGEVLVDQGRRGRAGEDGAPAAAVLRDEEGVGGRLVEAPRRPRPPAGLCDGARVDRLDRGRKEVRALEEEGALLREEEGEAL